MAFSVEDFQDLVRLLEERPEWRAELRRLVLTDELLGLPALVRELVDAQRRTEGALGELAAAQRETAGHVSELRGDFLERRYRDHAGAYFGRLPGPDADTARYQIGGGGGIRTPGACAQRFSRPPQ